MTNVLNSLSADALKLEELVRSIDKVKQQFTSNIKAQLERGELLNLLNWVADVPFIDGRFDGINPDTATCDKYYVSVVSIVPKNYSKKFCQVLCGSEYHKLNNGIDVKFFSSLHNKECRMMVNGLLVPVMDFFQKHKISVNTERLVYHDGRVMAEYVEIDKPVNMVF